MSDWPLIALVFLTIVTLLVAAHELGHYLFARLFKMGVEEFAIGFGRPSWIWRKKTTRNEAGEEETTEYRLRAWPLGGFVRIKGMVPEEDGSETQIPGGFYSKPPWQRFIVLFAGPVFSFLAGWVVLVPVLISYGVREPLNEPVLGQMSKEKPAYLAGVRPGDRVLSIDGKPLKTYFEMVRLIQGSEGKQLAFRVQREGRELLYAVTPEMDRTPGPLLNERLEIAGEGKAYRIGAGFTAHLARRSVGDAMAEAALLPFRMAGGLIRLAGQPSRLKDEVGGPATIVAATAASTREGVWPTISMAGLLSMSLGIMNLLPVVPFDGGQMMVAFIEMLRRGRRLSYRIQNMVAGFGFAVLALLIIGVFAVDAKRFLPFLSDKEKTAPVATAPEK